jgi:transcriptional antiterminator RfaH
MMMTPHSMAITALAWYVIQTKTRQEFRAEEQLRNQGFRCILPALLSEKIQNGRRLFASEPLFARYLFIELGAETKNWGAIRSTRGVSRLVTFGGVPAKIPQEWIDAFQRHVIAPKRLFEPGQRVIVTDGPFEGIEGIYQMPDSEARAIVLLELLSRPCKGSFPIEALKRAA